jgi:hypothetical protein
MRLHELREVMSNADAEQRRSPLPGDRPPPAIRPQKRLDSAGGLDLISTPFLEGGKNPVLTLCSFCAGGERVTEIVQKQFDGELPASFRGDVCELPDGRFDITAEVIGHHGELQHVC